MKAVRTVNKYLVDNIGLLWTNYVKLLMLGK